MIFNSLNVRNIFFTVKESRTCFWGLFLRYSPVLGFLIVSTFLVAGFPGNSGDSMQFQFLSKIFGVPHPPGAPVYILMVWLWNHLLFFSSPAAATNGFSVFSAFVALIALTELLKRWNFPTIAMVVSLVFLWVSPLWLKLSSVAELYIPALAAGLISLVLAQFWADKKGSLVLVGAALGLGYGIHPTVILFGPACLILLLQRKKRIWKESKAWIALVVFIAIIGLSISWVVYLASSSGVAFSWSHISDFETGLSFVSAKSFRQDFGFSFSELVFNRVPQYFTAVLWQQVWLIPLGVLGLIVSLRSLRGLAVLSIFLANAFYVLPYDVWDVWDFVLPGQLVVSLWIGWGLAWLVDNSKYPQKRWVDAVIFTLLLTTGIVWQLPENIKLVTHQTKTRFWENSAREILEIAGPGTVVVSPLWDISCALWYQSFVNTEKFADVKVIHCPTDESVFQYVRGAESLWQIQQNTEIKPGREVFVLGQDLLKKALAEGFVAYSFPSDIHLIKNEGDPFDGGRWPEIEPEFRVLGMFRLKYSTGWGDKEEWGRWMLSQEGELALKNLPLEAMLRIETSLWAPGQPPVTVEAFLDDEAVGEFTVSTEPWRAQIFEIPLGNTTKLKKAQLVLKVSDLFTAPGDRQRALPVSSISLVSTH